MSSISFDFLPHHLGVSVPDLDSSISWYSDMLGFELDFREFVKVIPAEVAFMRRGNFRIELFQVEGAEPLPSERRHPNQDVRTHGNKHLCLAVQDVGSAIATLTDKGVDVVFEKEVLGTPMAFIRDNAGNLIEFIQCPELFQVTPNHTTEKGS
ncbi:VOC family protein [Pseudomonas putida]|uniref:VOC family protein n=1 Tax=Pseudomonas putida TaxID=303 RepID=UPI001EDC6732|nr:VOC family protein [Pseudomonas putida]